LFECLKMLTGFKILNPLILQVSTYIGIPDYV
jgi:hypothetical protein